MVVVGGSVVVLACVVAGRVVVGLGGDVEIVTPAPAVTAVVVGVARGRRSLRDDDGAVRARAARCREQR